MGPLTLFSLLSAIFILAKPCQSEPQLLTIFCVHFLHFIAIRYAPAIWLLCYYCFGILAKSRKFGFFCVRRAIMICAVIKPRKNIQTYVKLFTRKRDSFFYVEYSLWNGRLFTLDIEANANCSHKESTKSKPDIKQNA